MADVRSVLIDLLLVPSQEVGMIITIQQLITLQEESELDTIYPPSISVD